MCCFSYFFSSRRRHTRCALVTGVQTCALPICRKSTVGPPSAGYTAQAERHEKRTIAQSVGDLRQPAAGVGLVSRPDLADTRRPTRSEERREGKEGGRTCRSRWSAYH